MRGRYLSKERGIFVVGDKQGCLSGRVALRIERQLLIICRTVWCTVLSAAPSCENGGSGQLQKHTHSTPPHPRYSTPTPPGPANKCQHHTSEPCRGMHAEAPTPLRRGHLPAKRRCPIAPKCDKPLMCRRHNARACSVSTPYRWIRFLGRISLQRRANRQRGAPLQVIETTDPLIHLHPSGVI